MPTSHASIRCARHAVMLPPLMLGTPRHCGLIVVHTRPRATRVKIPLPTVLPSPITLHLWPLFLLPRLLLMHYPCRTPSGLCFPFSRVMVPFLLAWPLPLPTTSTVWSRRLYSSRFRQCHNLLCPNCRHHRCCRSLSHLRQHRQTVQPIYQPYHPPRKQHRPVHLRHKQEHHHPRRRHGQIQLSHRLAVAVARLLTRCRLCGSTVWRLSTPAQISSRQQRHGHRNTHTLER